MFSVTIDTAFPQQIGEVWTDMSCYDITSSRLQKTLKAMPETEVNSAIIEAIENAPTASLKIQILSLIAYKYTRKQLCAMSNSIYKGLVDAAQEHSVKEGAGAIKEPPEITRDRLNEEKVNHFFSFITRPDYVQDVAYGVQRVTVGGQEESIPGIIRTVVNGRLIKVYLEFCRQTKFKDPLSECVLYKLLESCPAKHTKALAGLDNIAANGESACSLLVNLLRQLKSNSPDAEHLDKLEKMAILIQELSIYLKQEIKSHISVENNCADHCLSWALSDSDVPLFQSKCKHKHNIECDKCISITQLGQNIHDLIEPLEQLLGEKYEEIAHDIDQYVSHITKWRSHIMRTINQARGKDDILKNLKDNEVLIVIDYPMKYLPKKFREPQESFYGKEGLSWHVAVAIESDPESDGFNLTTLVTMLNKTSQDSYAVCSILHHILHYLKETKPKLKKCYLRSDNAGYYHCVGTLVSVSKNCGLQVSRYDFSEAQSGKDVCDRKTVPVKAHINRYCDSGKDVTNAAEMRVALLSYGGVTGTKVSVMLPDADSKPSEAPEIPKRIGISKINNVEYRRNGMLVHRAYGIGKGMLIRKDEIENMPEPPKYSIITEFNSTESLGHMSITEKQDEEDESMDSDTDEGDADEAGKLFQCPTCTKSFIKQHNLDRHVITGKHVSPKPSGYEKMTKKWVNFAQAREINPTEQREVPTQGKRSARVHVHPTQPMGWALKRSARSPMKSTKMVDYLTSLFDIGERTKNKVTPEEAVTLIRSARDEKGNREFAKEEWLSASQIKKFFGRIAAQRRYNFKKIDDVPEEYIEDPVSELVRKVIKNVTKS